ncbi:MAG: hypothetical protein AAF985_26575 [Bacteroidota bacterium]
MKMRDTLRYLPVLLLLSMLLYRCDNAEDLDPEVPSFLSEIRPIYFENLNFESEVIRSQTSDFLLDLAASYNQLETEYEAGVFVDDINLEYMRLAGMYYSFYLLAVTGNYLDGNLSFEDINGGRQTGYYSNLPATTPDFQQQELEALMERASRVAFRATEVNGFNDKSYGFYLSVRQVQERLKNPNHYNSHITQDSVINYVFTRLVNYDLLPDWNVLMAMVTFTNYADSLNRFDNPRMDEVLLNVNARLRPGALADLGGRYPEILGPLYRFDLNLKKIDWLLRTGDELDEDELEELKNYITILETSSAFIEEEQTELLSSWPHRHTFEERKEKMKEIKDFRQSVIDGDNSIPRPKLAPYLDTKSFKKAYQCYSCHKPAGM